MFFVMGLSAVPAFLATVAPADKVGCLLDSSFGLNLLETSVVSFFLMPNFWYKDPSFCRDILTSISFWSKFERCKRDSPACFYRVFWSVAWRIKSGLLKVRSAAPVFRIGISLTVSRSSGILLFGQCFFKRYSQRPRSLVWSSFIIFPIWGQVFTAAIFPVKVVALKRSR